MKHANRLLWPKTQVAEDYRDDAEAIILHGDSRQTLKAIPSNSVKLIITSPPYNLGKAYEKANTLERYLSELKPILVELMRVLSPEGSVCWQVGNYVENSEVFPLDIYYYPVFKSLGLSDSRRMARSERGIMQIAAEYSFNEGKREIKRRFPSLLAEVHQAIEAVKAGDNKNKKSVEKTMPGKMLFDPRALNNAFKKAFLQQLDWAPIRVPCEYPIRYYVKGYKNRQLHRGAFREMDFVKQKLGVEVQFGKYAFMVYNVCAKMTIFHKLGHIDCGIEIVPVKAFADEMSTGVFVFRAICLGLRTSRRLQHRYPRSHFGDRCLSIRQSA